MGAVLAAPPYSDFKILQQYLQRENITGFLWSNYRLDNSEVNSKALILYSGYVSNEFTAEWSPGRPDHPTIYCIEARRDKEGLYKFHDYNCKVQSI